MRVFVTGYRRSYVYDMADGPPGASFNVKALVKATRARKALERKQAKESARADNPRKVRSDKGKARKPKA